MKPEILLHPNIPKPLHGLNPRTVKGQEWWDIQRQKAYRKYDFRCWACGVHKSEAKYHHWLEGHEFYEYNYPKGRAFLKEIVALCHCCHNFIHSGKTEMDYTSGTIGAERFEYILQHGARVLIKANLPMNTFAYNVAKRNSINISMPQHIQSQDDSGFAEWEDWRLEIDGVLYSPIFKSFEEWKSHYRRKT